MDSHAFPATAVSAYCVDALMHCHESVRILQTVSVDK